MSVDQPYHHGSLRRALLAGAEIALERDGAEGLSLRKLAREAGVSHAAPSKHFRDRRALLDALAESGFHRLTETLAAAVSTAAPDARDRFAALASAYVGFALAHPALLALMYGTKHAPGAPERLTAAGRASMDLTVRVVAEAQAAGDIRSGNADRVALVAFATFHGVATLAAGGLLDGAPVDEVVAAALDVFWGGVVRD